MHKARFCIFIWFTFFQCCFLKARRYGFGPLFSFGQHILPDKTRVISNALWYARSEELDFTVFSPSYLYAIRKELVLVAELPAIIQYNATGQKSKGIGDFRLQAEMMAYKYETEKFQEYITLVTTLRFPTATSGYVPILATKTANLLLGITGITQDDDWYFAASLGGYVYPADSRIYVRDQVLYEFVLGRTFISKKNDTLNILLEVNGVYQLPDSILGDTGNTFQQREGRTVIYFGPLVRWLRGRSLLQIGFQLPIVQSSHSEVIGRLDYRTAVMLSIDF